MTGEAQRRLLVVDDEVETCNFVRMFFEQRGFKVFTAFDGDEAVKVAEEARPHVVLLDVKMKSAEDGFEALPRIKKILPSARVLMVTGNEDEAGALRCKALGADDYITKPLILEYLEKTVIKKVRDVQAEA